MMHECCALRLRILLDHTSTIPIPDLCRYTVEMSKLEASLSEMERELTRAEAAHSRERRELIDKEASALADRQRFRNRSILLEEKVR